MNKFKMFFLVFLALSFSVFAMGKPVEASKKPRPTPRPTITPSPVPTSAPRTMPYACGQDLCMGYRCVIGNMIRPACYNADEIKTVSCSGGVFEYIPTFNKCYSSQYYFNWGI